MRATFWMCSCLSWIQRASALAAPAPAKPWVLRARCTAVQVVLPLLQNEVVTTGWVSEADFLTGLALVQAMPGPLFNFAAYLGTLQVLLWQLL